MNEQTLHLIYFSPTHSSRKIAYAIADEIPHTYLKNWDLTNERTENNRIEDGIVIVAVPVYGGRVSETALQRLNTFTATQIPVIPVVLYGNRDYEDALLELVDLLKNHGFIPVVAGAFIGEHSYSTKDMPIAAGRPDNEDIETARLFGMKANEKMKGFFSGTLPELTVKGHSPYKEKGPHTPQAPVTEFELCTLCEYCIGVCPTEAISIKDEKIFSDPAFCIKCCACVKECPEEARLFETPFRAYLYEHFSSRKEPELFI